MFNLPNQNNLPLCLVLRTVDWGLILPSNYGYDRCHRVELWISLPIRGFFRLYAVIGKCHSETNLVVDAYSTVYVIQGISSVGHCGKGYLSSSRCEFNK